jgi:hypothetical protein
VRIAGNAAGDAMVLWAERYNDQSDIFACRYSADEGWEEPILIGNALEHLGSDIVVDAFGNAFAVWMTTSTSAHCPSGKCGIWTNHYRVGEGWQTAQRIHDGWTFDDNKDLSVAIDSEGNVIAVWKQVDTLLGGEIILGSRYVLGAYWTQLEEVASFTHATAPHVAVDLNGEAAVVFRVSSETTNDVRTSRFINEIGWETEIIHSESYTGFNPLPMAKHTIDPLGRVTVIWPNHNLEPTEHWTISALRFE